MPDEETKTLTLHVEGKYSDGSQISLDNLSLGILKAQMECISSLLGADDGVKQNTRISLEDGSLTTLLMLPALAYNVISADIAKYSSGDYNSISEPIRKKALDKYTKSMGVEGWNLSILSDDGELYNSSKAVAPVIKDVEVELEMDIEGRVTDAGGRRRPNIHVENKKKGQKYTIATSQAQLAELKTNILYHDVYLHVSYKYNLQTKACRDFRLKEILEDRGVNMEKLNIFIEQESDCWKDIVSPELWLAELRGEND